MAASTPPIRIALVEDDRQFADTLRRYFELGKTVDCAAVFPSAEDALRGIPTLSPEVLLVDINLPKMNGVELVARIKAISPAVLCVILTMYEESGLIFDALKAGACGYLLKRTPPEEIVAAIEQVRAGGSPMSPQIARHVVSFFHTAGRANDAELETLTDREREVLALLSKGFMYKRIGDQLHISLDTVRFHLRKIYEKLQVHSRAEATMKYLGQNVEE
jgi:DNA-binding NarL/FixJ family response regulator